MGKRNRSRKAKPPKIRVQCLSSDYDGTISPLNASRIESRVPLETRVMLRQIGRFLPISIITMKDLPFIIPRTPFAHAWSGIGGLETRIGKRVLKREHLENRLPRISLAIDCARSRVTSPGVEIEEKTDSEGHTVAFCVDWRRARDSKTAKQEAERVATFCKTLELRVIGNETQPFYDVYPVAPDKGRALQEMVGELAVKAGVLYMGDSEADNTAFKEANISVGVMHKENFKQNLLCDYFVEFQQIDSFLKMLLANHLVFSSNFPMVRTNQER